MIRPVAMITVILGLVAATWTAQAAPLKPYQQAALEEILAAMDPQSRSMARPQLEQMLSMLGEAEVEMMLAAMAEQAASADGETASGATMEDTADAVASPDDLEFNRAQYEPAIRNAWAANRKFDDFVDATLAAHCPAAGTYAVWGQAWRYEVMALAPNWTRASNSADLDVQILGASYAPQDGRYRFDFSGVRSDFDPTAVAQAIEAACGEYRRIGDEFMATARAGMRGDDLPGGFELEQRSNAAAAAVLANLEQLLGAQAPGADGALFQALLNGERL